MTSSPSCTNSLDSLCPRKSWSHGKTWQAPDDSITIPLGWIHTALTSPVTISLAIKLSVLGLLTLGSGLFSMLAVGAWWYSWGTGAPIEVEGWLFYG